MTARPNVLACRLLNKTEAPSYSAGSDGCLGRSQSCSEGGARRHFFRFSKATAAAAAAAAAADFWVGWNPWRGAVCDFGLRLDSPYSEACDVVPLRGRWRLNEGWADAI